MSTAAGAVPVRAPRVNDKRIDEETGERRRFSSAILPAWARKSPQVAEVLPLLYLHGLSTSDFGAALEQFLGSGAGLSAATVTRLTTQWQDDSAAFNKRSLADTDYVYVWVDGIHLKVRLEQDKVCLLVMLGVRADGHKELIALADGFRESSESWADLLRDCKRRGMRAPVLAVGDGRWGSGRLSARCSPTPRTPTVLATRDDSRAMARRTCRGGVGGGPDARRTRGRGPGGRRCSAGRGRSRVRPARQDRSRLEPPEPQPEPPTRKAETDDWTQVPTADEIAEAVARARRALVAMNRRQEHEEQRIRDESREVDLARWHAEHEVVRDVPRAVEAPALE